MSKRLKCITKRYLALILIPLMVILASPVMAAGVDMDFTQPNATGLYGGLIHWVEVIDLGDGMSRVFVSTQSANTMFYADIDHTQENPFENVTFQVVPDLDADAGFGEIQNFAVDERSGWVYFAWWPEDSSNLDSDDQQPGIYRCITEAGSITQVEFESEEEHGPGSGLGYVQSLTIHDGYMFFIEQTWSQERQTDILRLRFGTINETTGDFTESDESPILLRSSSNGAWIKQPVVHPLNNYLYILDCGQNWDNQHIDSVIYKSSDTYDALTGSTTFRKIIPPAGSEEMPRQYEALGIAPDGVIFLAGWQQTNRNYSESVVVYSSNDGASWQTGSRDEYCWAWQGPNFAFVDNDSGGYDIITGTMFSEDSGATWGMLPRTGNVWPHPGSIAFDPNDEDTFYVQMDRGIAVTTDAGYSFSRAWQRPEGYHIEDIEVIDLGGNKSGIYIRENEHNNPGDPYLSPRVYYAEIDHSADTPVYGSFQAVPGMGEGSSWEIWSQFTGDSTSGFVFFEGTPDNDTHDLNGLYRTNGTTAPVKVTIESGYASRPLIHDGYMFYVDSSWGGGYWEDGYWTDGYWEGDPQWIDGYYDDEGNWIEGHYTEGETWVDGYWTDGYWVEGTPASTLYYGTINANGDFVSIGDVEVTDTANLWPERMAVNPSDGSIYILSRSGEGGINMFRSSDAYDELSDSTTFTVIDPPGGDDSLYDWRAFGICPDGRLLLAGWSQSGAGENTVAYSENDGDSWEIVSLDNEYCGIGEEFAFLETPSGYDIFCGTLVSDDNGVNWANLPRRDYEKATPNSACIQIDPNDPQVLYIPTSKGVGYSTDAGYHFYDMNDGIEAVQIKDIVLDPVSGTGWAVAKSGVYRVYDFATDPTWSAPMDPDDSGGWYEVVEMDLSDETGNTAYVGTEWGDRVFKTTDGGRHWKSLWRPQPQFEPDELPNNWCYPNWAGNVSDIKVDPYDSDRVFIGYDTGIWGWGENMDERVFGQLWVYEEGSGEPLDTDDPWMWGPPQNRDWTKILLYRSETDSEEMIASGSDGTNTWYSLKGDINILDILITQEDGETVIYVATSYSDEDATPISDQEKMYTGLYDSSGYPLIYDIYRITGDRTSGWDVEADFGDRGTSITALAIDSDGTLYAYGHNYDEKLYQRYLDGYYKECREEMFERHKAEASQDFYDEVYDGFYDELIDKLYGIGEGYFKGYHEGWDEHFEEAFNEFYDKYFSTYEGEYGDDFDVYFEQCVDEYFQDRLLKEFNKHFDEEWKNENRFEDFWDHSKPQPGLRAVYKKPLGGEWKILSIDGLNKAYNMHHYFDNNQGAMTVGPDPLDSTVEIPYVAFNRFIYYLPDGANEWVLGSEYPLGTEIYVIVSMPLSEEMSINPASPAEGASTDLSGGDSSVLASLKGFFDLTPKTVCAAESEGAYLYVGTGTGLYGQLIVKQAGIGGSSVGSGSVLGLGIIIVSAAIVSARTIVFILGRVQSR